MIRAIKEQETVDYITTKYIHFDQTKECTLKRKIRSLNTELLKRIVDVFEISIKEMDLGVKTNPMAIISLVKLKHTTDYIKKTIKKRGKK
jgi:hypothetical protein